MSSPRPRPLVMLVDDDQRSIGLLSRMLEADGFDTEVTTDGAAALVRLARDPFPGAVVTDFQLPHADGLSIARYARSRDSTVGLIFVTGYPQLLGKNLTQDESPIVLTKPLEYSELLVRLDQVLGAQA